jgi:hypothetical protein
MKRSTERGASAQSLVRHRMQASGQFQAQAMLSPAKGPEASTEWKAG